MSTGQQKRMRRNRHHTWEAKPGEEDRGGNSRIMSKAWLRSQGMVDQHPMSTALVVFGIGLGIGVALGSMISAATTPPPSFGQRAELAAEKLGRQMLDAIAGVLPTSIAKHVA